jgi:hypothetical protein
MFGWGVWSGCQVEPFLLHEVNRRVEVGVGCANIWPVDRLLVLLSAAMLQEYNYAYANI